MRSLKQKVRAHDINRPHLEYHCDLKFQYHGHPFTCAGCRIKRDKTIHWTFWAREVRASTEGSHFKVLIWLKKFWFTIKGFHNFRKIIWPGLVWPTWTNRLSAIQPVSGYLSIRPSAYLYVMILKTH